MKATGFLALATMLSGALLVAACGGGEGGGNGTAAEVAKEGGAAPTSWKATDACSILDKAVLGAALGTDVTEASVALVHEGDATSAATSECTYILASGGRATLATRWSPISDNTPEAIATARSATEQSVKAFSSKPVEDVPGLGKAAFWVPGINQLNVFLDDKRFVILTLSSAPDATAKDLATELVRKIS